jgi:serine/threonine-protein kinase
MNPVGMLWARAQGSWDFGPASNALLMHSPDYLLVGVAVVISHVVTTLGRQVAKAREMGSYQLGELLGRGGMGEVYKASHRMLARPAAIKLIRPEMLGGNDPAVAARAIARFRREAEAAAQLRSAHTVDLYDFGVTEDQTLYLVMEFLDGMDLESLVQQYGPMPSPRVIHVLRQVCDSLEEAHARGLVHRDIKPANIHLGRVGCREDFVKVLDFGLVKTAAVGATQSLATIEGVITGTPAYMAPEMALGDPVDARADLYALGCVAYYLLSGEQVFTGETALKVITQHLQAVPVPPSKRTELPIPATLEHLVLACLAKTPEQRPQSARQLAESLDTIDVMTWGDEEAHRWWSQHHRERKCSKPFTLRADNPPQKWPVEPSSGNVQKRLYSSANAAGWFRCHCVHERARRAAGPRRRGLCHVYASSRSRQALTGLALERPELPPSTPFSA